MDLKLSSAVAVDSESRCAVAVELVLLAEELARLGGPESPASDGGGDPGGDGSGTSGSASG